MKFEMLKVGQMQIITFDIKKAVSFDGFTAGYVQYACARINSLLKNIDLNFDFKNLSFNNPERLLLLEIAKYPEIVKKAGSKFDPSEIAKYLFSLAQAFSDYYHEVAILKEEDEKIKNSRLLLVSQIRQVLKNGFNLLGVDIVEEM